MKRRETHRRITVWLAIIGYSLVASGLPLPVERAAATAAGGSAAAQRLSAKDRSRPFPCMDKPCGCATAEQCFTSCCCSTPAERLAWARARGVDAAVLAALAQRQGGDGCHADADAAESPCCRAQAAASRGCCTTAVGDASPHAGLRPTTAPAPVEPPSAGGTVVLRAMLACGGIVSQWCSAGASLPPPVVEPPVDREPIAVLVIRDEAAVAVPAVPAAPPPRTA